MLYVLNMVYGGLIWIFVLGYCAFITGIQLAALDIISNVINNCINQHDRYATRIRANVRIILITKKK